MDNLNDWDLPIVEHDPWFEEVINQQSENKHPTSDINIFGSKNCGIYAPSEDKIQDHHLIKAERSKIARDGDQECEKIDKRFELVSEKGKAWKCKDDQSIIEKSSSTNDECILISTPSAEIIESNSSSSQVNRVETRRENFRENLASSKRAILEVEGSSINKDSGSISNHELFLNTWVDCTPTSARSFGVLKNKESIWRDFAYRLPWPEPPESSHLLSPDGFGKYFSRSSEEYVKTPITGEPRNQQIKCDFGNKGEIFSDPRTSNKVDRWLQFQNNQKRSLWEMLFTSNPEKSLLKQIFNDPKEAGLIRDVLALIDFKRMLKRYGFRHKSAKNFIKYYKKDAEVVLTRFRKQPRYREKKVPSFDKLHDLKKWRQVCAPWRAPYTFHEITSLHLLQKDANSLARSYLNIRLQENSDSEFIPIYRAFFQLELYCELFRVSNFTTPETSGENLELIKRIFFERYQPYEAELVLKISRWLVREWNTIDRLGDGQLKDTIREKMKKAEIYEANSRYLGIRFFSELLYSDLATQTALIYRNKWQLNLIKFAWLTNCWAAQDVDEHGNVLFIEDQELIEDEASKKQQPTGSWIRLEI